MSKNNQKSKKEPSGFTIRPLSTTDIPADQLELIPEADIQNLVDLISLINKGLEKGKIIHPYWVRFFTLAFKIKYINESWYKYTSGVYKQLDYSTIMNLVNDILYSVHPEGASEANTKKIVEMWLHKCKTFAEPPADLINCVNGYLNPVTKKLSKHTPETISFTQFNFSYKKKLPIATTFLKFLGEALAYDESMMRLIQKFMGNCLISGSKFGKALWLYGEGGTGKSTMADIIELLVGSENTAIVDLALITNDQKAKTIIVGKRLFRSEEANQGYINDNLRSFIQRVITGESLQLRDNYQSVFSYKPDCKVVFTSNRLPDVTDSSNGFWRRVIPVSFMKFPDNPDQFLIDKIKEEMDGVFQFALEGLDLLLAEGYHEPDSVKLLKEEWRENSDPVLIFINECVRETKQSYDKIQATAIFKKYNDWAAAGNYHFKPNQTKFGMLFTGYLSKTSIIKEKDGKYVYYKGIELVD